MESTPKTRYKLRRRGINSIGLTSINGIIDGQYGSYEKLVEASVIHLNDTNQLDTTELHGDG